MAYALHGSVSPVDGSGHAPIDVADFLACPQDLISRDHWTALVRPLDTLRLWQGLHRRAVHISIVRMDLVDIHRGRGGRFRVGGTGSKFLMV